MPLHDAVRLLAGEALAGQGEQDCLGAEGIARLVQVRLHLFVDDPDPPDHLGEPVEHVIENDGGVGNDHPLHR